MLMRCLVAMVAASTVLSHVADAALIYTGPNTTFTKSDFADPTLAAGQDRITDNVWITRGDLRGIFNAVTENAWGGSSSPADTEWAFAGISNPTGDAFQAANFENLTFSDWKTAIANKPGDGNMVGRPAVLHLVTDDHYIDLTFTQWTQNRAGGGFSYTRATIPEPSTLCSALLAGVAGCGVWMRRRLA